MVIRENVEGKKQWKNGKEGKGLFMGKRRRMNYKRRFFGSGETGK